MRFIVIIIIVVVVLSAGSLYMYTSTTSPAPRVLARLLSAHRDLTEIILYVFPSWLFHASIIDLDLLVLVT